MHRLAKVPLVFVLALLAPVVVAAQPATPAPMSPEPLIYHQISMLEDGAGGVGPPVISGDGSTAVFTDSPAVANDPEHPNRILAINFDGSGQTEIDAYEPNCFCGTWVDISFDGSTIVSTDSMQLRLTAGGAEAALLLDLTSNEMSSLRITAAGDHVFFLLARDTQVVDAPDILQRGIYRIDADGSNLEQLAGPDQVAQLLGVAPDQVQMLRLQTNALDISADGSRIVFGAWIGAQQAVFAMDGDGRDLHQLSDEVSNVLRVAMSGDGALIAFDIIPANSSDNEIHVVPAGGGDPDAGGQPYQFRIRRTAAA